VIKTFLELITSSDFLTSFWANAFSDILFGAVFGTFFGIISTRLITKMIDSRNTPDLSFYFMGEDGSQNIPVDNWPPTVAKPASASIRIGMENNGKAAAENWMIVLEFKKCDDFYTGKPLYRVCIDNTQLSAAYGPIIEYHSEKSLNTTEIVRLQYASPADMIHSRFKNFSPPNFKFGLVFYKGYDDGGNYRSVKFKVYADNMKVKSGTISLNIIAPKEKTPHLSGLQNPD
jgi:hypothetical protein